MGRPRPKAAVPQSEEDELRFWDEHDPSEFDEGAADLIVRLKRRPKKVITFRLDEELYEELRHVAATHGVPYQRLMRELLRSSLKSLRRTPTREKSPLTARGAG
jgi:predicted DNA binding CopG/RHH family protein